MSNPTKCIFRSALPAAVSILSLLAVGCGNEEATTTTGTDGATTSTTSETMNMSKDNGSGETPAIAGPPAPTEAPAGSGGGASGAFDTRPFQPSLPAKTTASGIKIEEMTVGKGATAEAGKMVYVHYTGTLTNGTKFDSSRDRGSAFDFPLGAGRVIQGWDEGVAGMKVGGRRRLTIPANLAYGEQSPSPDIPANSILVFDVELMDVQ